MSTERVDLQQSLRGLHGSRLRLESGRYGPDGWLSLHRLFGAAAGSQAENEGLSAPSSIQLGARNCAAHRAAGPRRRGGGAMSKWNWNSRAVCWPCKDCGCEVSPVRNGWRLTWGVKDRIWK